jgi:hypothetical protein
MPKPKPRQIAADAHDLKDRRFKKRDLDLEARHRDRFREGTVDVPTAYKKTATVVRTPIIQEEGRQVAALVHADAIPHVVPPTPEDQASTTRCEQWLMAAEQELEAAFGNNAMKNTQAQIHDGIAWRYRGAKRKPYDGQPTAPNNGDMDDIEAIDALVEFDEKNDAYKREAGISAVFDDRHVPTGTMYTIGDVFNPLRVYEIKDVDEAEFMATYNVRKDRDGQWQKVDKDAITTMPSGDPVDMGNTREKTIRVIEYWDREWCMILVENIQKRWMGLRNQQLPLVLEEWEHGWGRVPYFARPAFENEVSEEEHRFESPLNGLYAEVPHHNAVETMKLNVMWLTGYPSWQIITKESGDQILDDSGNPKTQIEFTPGYMFQAAPGQQVASMPMENGQLLPQEAALSAARLQQFSLSPIAKGVSPGADTANSALSQLRRLQRSSLNPMADNTARQYREMWKFMLQRVQELGESVYVYARDSGEMIGLAPEDIPTLNVQSKVEPDTGQDALLVEKAAREAYLTGAITELEYHELRGKENPDEYVSASALDRLRRSFEPELFEATKAAFGQTGAIMRLIAAQQETGDAKSAVESIMNDFTGLQRGQVSGMGSGSGGQPRSEGVRSPFAQETTQPMAELGV